MSTPDIAAFTDAQQRLREAFGEPVTFVKPGVKTYPPGTALDESGAPMDALVQPVTNPETTAIVNCNIAFRSELAEADETGWHDVEHVRFIADISDRAKIDGATVARARGQEYEIVSTTPDGIGGVQRYLVEGHKR